MIRSFDPAANPSTLTIINRPEWLAERSVACSTFLANLGHLGDHVSVRRIGKEADRM